MLSVGMRLYNLKEEEVIINDLVGNKIDVTTITEIKVSYNNGTENIIQEYKKNESFQIQDLGVLLFFSKEDIQIDPFIISNNPEYVFNRDKILKNAEENELKIMELIKSQEPKNPMNLMQKKRIIEGYLSDEESKKEEREFYNKYFKIQPYFGRMDFDTQYYIPRYKEYHVGYYYEKFYIGKNLDKDVSVKLLDYNIIDWRSKIASMYYESEKTIFTAVDIGTYNSELMLKRKFQFNPNSFTNIYIIDNDLYEEGSVDPFLIEVLEENRSNHIVGDIIKSIQSNQNSIIRQEPRISAVIQGCAGSGKTMILLHRLSYLKFNNYLSDLTRVKIITPNKLFVSFMESLSNSLELSEIDHITMDDYYYDIANRYITNYNIRSNNTKYKKLLEDIKKQSNQKASEREGLSSCFSENSVLSLKEIYERRLLEWQREVSSTKVMSIRKKIDDYTEIEDFKLNYELSNQKDNLKKADLLGRNTKIKEKINYISDRINEVSNEFNAAKKVNYNTVCLIRILEEKIEKYNSLKRKYSYKGIKGVMNRDLSILNLTGKKESDEEIYNDILLDSKELNNKITQYIASLKEDRAGMSPIFSRETEMIEEYFNAISNELKSFHSNNNLNDLRTIPLKAIKGYLEVLGGCYNICGSNNDGCFKLLDGYDFKLNELKSERNNLVRLKLSQEEIELFVKIEGMIEKKDELIFHTYYEFLANQKVENMFEFGIKESTQIQIFTFVNLLYLHYGPLIEKDSFVFIDEGQDYSIEEYKLINNINGGQAMLNVYGDINQVLSEERSILNWKTLVDQLDGNYYELNENYRNTVEITNYCNDKFNYNHKAIGLRGPNVEYIKKSMLKGVIEIILNRDGRTRIAIIKNEEEADLINILGKYKSLLDKSIVVGNVKKVKGLEFDTVFVFPGEMSNNELYISYTRSLKKLYIIE